MNKKSMPVPVPEINITGKFWKQYMELVRNKVIPYQWKALNNEIEGEDQNACMQNFKVAAGLEKGSHVGMVFQDSDFAKWIEAVGFSLMWHKDADLEKCADDAIDIVVAAQQPDGYLNTYYIINGLDKRFTNLKDNHELYCLGHLIEGAVVYYQGTGKDKLLKACERYIDLIIETFGIGENKLPGYPGHEVIEMALSRLHDVTGDDKYLELAKYFIDQRGQDPLYFKWENEANRNEFYWRKSPFQYAYYQAGQPVRSQKDAEGHAVRAVYLYCGLAEVARKTNDEELKKVCVTLWNSIVEKQMYITGGIGSSAYGEAFTFDYDLPNDTVYAETCASIGLVFFAQRMLKLKADARYADVMERALYNGILSGMALDGQKFFYVNPLEVLPIASQRDHLRGHVKVERQKWYACACCPPNAARLLASIGSYAWGQDLENDTLYMHLFMGSELTKKLGGKDVTLKVETDYPWKEDIHVSFAIEGDAEFTFAVRRPTWAHNIDLLINGNKVCFTNENGYAYITRKWSNGDKLVYHIPMQPEIVTANPKVREDIGKAAVVRGPIVYCLEEADNGKDLHLIRLGDKPDFKVAFEPDLLNGVVTLRSTAQKISVKAWPDNILYSSDIHEAYEPVTLKWIPYFAWTNREPGEMLVWVHR